MIIVGIDVPGKHTGGYAVYESGRVLEHGVIQFKLQFSELECYRTLQRLLTRLDKRYGGIGVIAIEHPFLHVIAQWVGGVKMWVAMHERCRWFMLTASMAQKAVFGQAIRKQRTIRLGPRAGQTVSDSAAVKRHTLRYVARKYHLRGLTQHEADAILYAMAVAIRVRQEEISA